MLTIYDDTYSLRAKDYSLEYLKEDKYRTLVNIIDEVIGARIKEETKKMQSSKLIACHKTIKFKTNDSLEYLSRELNAFTYLK